MLPVNIQTQRRNLTDRTNRYTFSVDLIYAPVSHDLTGNDNLSVFWRYIQFLQRGKRLFIVDLEHKFHHRVITTFADHFTRYSCPQRYAD